MEPFLGQIQAMGFTFAPLGWAKCDGQLLQISKNDALFSLLGTAYGGDGRTTFGLPDLRGRVSLHEGQGPGLSNFRIGEKSGVERVYLTTQQIPAHNHSEHVVAETPNVDKPSNALLATPDPTIYSDHANPDASLNGGMIGRTGGSQSHNNIQPYLVINWCIALVGKYPSRH